VATTGRFWLLYASTSTMNLERAAAVLREANFDVEAAPEGGFAARWFDGPMLQLRAGKIAEVRSAIVRITSATLPLTVAAFDACIAVSFPDLDDALDEINTLIESQSQLQAASGGAVFLEWNGNLELAGAG
jgi:hypothetical protein